MLKRRKRMCATCIYQTGELTRYKAKHECHEHYIANTSDESVACAGSCKPDGLDLIDTPTPNSSGFLWAGAEFVNSSICRLLAKGKGKQKMPEDVRIFKISTKLAKIGQGQKSLMLAAIKR